MDKKVSPNNSNAPHQLPRSKLPPVPLSESADLSAAEPPKLPPKLAIVPPSTNKPAKQSSPPAYNYFPGSPTEMFLYPMESVEAQKYGGEEKQKEMMRKAGKLKRKQQNGQETDQMEEADEENDEDEEKARKAAIRKKTKLYRILVWLQFSFTVCTCLFILVIMVLLAIILVMLSKTIDRADHAIRGNPVSQIYMKLKHAVDRIPGPG